MGKWLETVPTKATERRGIGPSGLITAIESLPHSARSEFPLLQRLNPRQSGEWWEEQLLSYEETVALLKEFRRLRRLCKREEFLPGVDGKAIFDRWRGDSGADVFGSYLEELEFFLIVATDDRAGLRFSW